MRQKDYNSGVESLRRTNLLELFIDHFLNMADNLISFKSLNQSTIYLNQAKRLCEIYRHMGCENGAIEFMSRREELEETVKLLRKNGTGLDPPPVPLRTSTKVEPKLKSIRKSVTRKSSILRRSVKSRRSVRFSVKNKSYEPRSNLESSEESEDEGIQECVTTEVTIENNSQEKINIPSHIETDKDDQQLVFKEAQDKTLEQDSIILDDNIITTETSSDNPDKIYFNLSYISAETSTETLSPVEEISEPLKSKTILKKRSMKKIVLVPLENPSKNSESSTDRAIENNNEKSINNLNDKKNIKNFNEGKVNFKIEPIDNGKNIKNLIDDDFQNKKKELLKKLENRLIKN